MSNIGSIGLENVRTVIMGSVLTVYLIKPSGFLTGVSAVQIIALLYNTGLRVGELVAVDVETIYE